MTGRETKSSPPHDPYARDQAQALARGSRPPGGLDTEVANVRAMMKAPALTFAPNGIPYSDKDRKTAGLLQLLLGGFGVGRFYLGYPKIAVLQILVTWLTLGAGVLWPMIDGVRILDGRVPDAKGRPLRDE